MTQMQSITPDREHMQTHLAGRAIGFLYGVAAYGFFFVTFLYAIGFVENLIVPRTIDSGPTAPTMVALVVDLVLMSIFALQHSIMARQGFKRWWTQFVPVAMERTTYVLMAT
ncbi:MAG: isoprenylcysteine carboxylmethyltransferase family protein, partial [Xanthobacteraceae bacterium]